MGPAHLCAISHNISGHECASEERQMADRLSAIKRHLEPPTLGERIVLPSEGVHGDRNGTATATCYCGAVQIEVPTGGDGLVDTFICHCTDCRKITASMFASNFIVKDTHLKHVRGEEQLSRFKQNRTIATGNDMENSFCRVCGTLMYRRSSGFPGMSIARIGTVDDFALQESVFKPRIETFEKDRCAWLQPAMVEKHSAGAVYTGGKPWRSSHDGAGGGGRGRQKSPRHD